MLLFVMLLGLLKLSKFLVIFLIQSAYMQLLELMIEIYMIRVINLNGFVLSAL